MSIGEELESGEQVTTTSQTQKSQNLYSIESLKDGVGLEIKDLLSKTKGRDVKDLGYIYLGNNYILETPTVQRLYILQTASPRTNLIEVTAAFLLLHYHPEVHDIAHFFWRVDNSQVNKCQSCYESADPKMLKKAHFITKLNNI